MADDRPALAPQDQGAADASCSVCGEELDPKHHALCEACSQLFHLRMTENEEARDCGQVFLQEENCTTVFLCNPCYAVHILKADP